MMNIKKGVAIMERLVRAVYYNRKSKALRGAVTRNFRDMWKLLKKDIKQYINNIDYDGYMRIVIYGECKYVISAYSVYGKIHVFVESESRSHIGTIEL